MKKFFEMAEKQPWFSNTVFVIVADHCASSAGKTELPVDKYRIPAMIYSPVYSATALYKADVKSIYANSFGY
jgi:phosphoglycerol transferase MdoB-like AlkP superfamily enzyme